MRIFFRKYYFKTFMGNIKKKKFFQISKLNLNMLRQLFVCPCLNISPCYMSLYSKYCVIIIINSFG